MGTFQRLEDAQEHFKKDRFATGNGMKIDEIGEDSCLCSMKLREDHRNAYGSVMGGVIFTLADFALAVASNQIHSLSVAQNASIHFLSAPQGDHLYARAQCLKSGKTTTVINVMVTDDKDRKVAQFTAAAFKL
ncbi:MAG: PaaI family thioesterase [Blautia sp.]|nr:PaaI family thioesterase [Blautia sp.]